VIITPGRLSNFVCFAGTIEEKTEWATMGLLTIFWCCYVTYPAIY